MQHSEQFRFNSETEDGFKITSFCVQHCQTINKHALTVSDAACLGKRGDT
jgi:hypothetical protein